MPSPSGCRPAEADIPVKLAILDPYPVLQDINLSGKNEPVNKKDEWGCGEQNEVSDLDFLNGDGR